jgi:hypothetical protein
VLPRVPWCQLPPPGSGQLGCRHASRGASSRLLARGNSGATTRPMAPAPTSWLGAAWVPPRVPWHQLPPPGSGQLRCHHVSHDTLQTAVYQSIRIFSGGITIIISYRGVHVSSKTPLDTASGALNTSKACGQGGGGCRTTTVQRRPAAHSQQIATVQGSSTALCSRVTTIPSDLTTRRRVAHVYNVAGQQDMMSDISLKTSFASPSW